MDFNQSPFLVIWELTRACGLACRHCRGEAIPGRDPAELGTDEGKRLLDDVAEMGTPILILSGGDPLERPDLEALVRHGKAAGLRVGTIPAATEKLTRARLRALKEAGLDQLALSLDGPEQAIHDEFRGTPGAFEKTLQAARWAAEEGLPLQVNTCIGPWNMGRLDGMISLVKSLGIVFWEVFFLVPVGRGRGLENLRPEQFEAVFDRLHRLSLEKRFIVKVTEAQHYRRFVMQREDSAEKVRDILARPRGAGGSLGQSPVAVNAGKGFAFVDHRGKVFPSGFLPIEGGDVRQRPLSGIYREAGVFRELRDPSLLRGRCGACSFREVCGGSRARAFALTGDYQETDPCCAYQP
ncbi:MAG: TIGR04053 family radical SAM/SPASM domain-containing protein [Elusimicrobiota bacterium]